VHHTLVLSPPQMGKTTLIRDIARQLSDGFPGFRGVKVGIVDERSEIAGCFQGVPQNNVGLQTDVLDACPKVEGIMMLIRSMSPAVIITDEIGKAEDVEAIEEALNAGIKIITTAHGSDIEEARRRRLARPEPARRRPHHRHADDDELPSGVQLPRTLRPARRAGTDAAQSGRPTSGGAGGDDPMRLSFYGALWRLLPGPVAVKAILALILFLAVVWGLMTWVFPAIAPFMPFNDVTVEGP